jgi:UDP-glucose 4-epimerase
MHLLIIGAGFMGEHLCRHFLARGHDVRVVDGEDRMARLAGLDRLDLRPIDPARIVPEADLFAGIDAVLHLYSRTSPASSMENIEADARANILPAIRILEGCRRHRIGTLVFASSGGTVYGAVSAGPASETHPTEPITAYGIGKLAVEKYLRLYARRDGIRTISLRIANAYGVGQLRGSSVGAIASFVRRVYRGEAVEIWGDGSTIRDYVYIGDIAAAFGLCLERLELPPGEYNIGSGVGYALRDVLAEIELVSGRRADVHYRPARAVDVPHLVLDCSKFRNAAGWAPEVSLREGVRILCKAAERGI